MKELETQERLQATVLKLETAAERIIKTNGYSSEVKTIRALVELIKEQLTNENPVSAARAIR